MLQALSEHIEAVKATLPEKDFKVKESKRSERALVEARVYLSGALFKMDHHPMEVWKSFHHAPSCTHICWFLSCFLCLELYFSIQSS
jgi:hypothetical protein